MEFLWGNFSHLYCSLKNVSVLFSLLKCIFNDRNVSLFKLSLSKHFSPWPAERVSLSPTFFSSSLSFSLFFFFVAVVCLSLFASLFHSLPVSRSFCSISLPASPSPCLSIVSLSLLASLNISPLSHPILSALFISLFCLSLLW